MRNQLSSYFEKILSQFQCGFREGFSTQHCLLLMLENWKHAVNNKKVFGILLTDLSKAFDCICHDLLIAYGLSLPALKLVHNYLQKSKQRTKNGTAYSLWEKIVSGVPQGLILGPFLFNIFLCNLFLTTEGNIFTNYADDTTPYVIDNNAEEVASELKAITQKLFTWFTQNKMKVDLNKCHLFLSTTDVFKFEISETVIRNSNSKRLLGVTFDNKLNFENHIITIFQRPNRKLNVLARLTPYIELGKHPFKELLEKDNSVAIHHTNIQALPTEMRKVAKGIAPEIMNEIFQLREKSHYNLRYTSEFIIPPIHSVYHGRESASYLGPKLWELIPTVIRQIDTLSGFKKAIKKWKLSDCPCRICKTYIPNVGFR